jgi:hypothetical protein
MKPRPWLARYGIVLLLATSAAVTSWAAEESRVAEDSPEEDSPTVKGIDVAFHAGARRGFASEGLGESANAASSGKEDTPDDVQINDPALDHVQSFAGTRPFEFSIQSETSLAAAGKNIVVGYNTTADSPVVLVLPNGLPVHEHRHFCGFSASHDGGRTWTSGFIPPAPGSALTRGDPSLGVDRKGHFYYACLGANASNRFGLIVGKSTDGGRTFAPAVVAALDEGADKEWLAVGRDPSARGRDNVYIAWTSFQQNGSQLRLVKSIDGGQSWSPQKILFAPVATGVLSSFIQFANPVVDASSGRLYVPFLHFGGIDEDFIRVLVSDDGGETFRFLRFDAAGAPDPFAFPNVTPGTVIDCGSPGGGIRLVLHQGANLGGGRLGLPRFRQATRLITQPAAAAANGRIFIALNSSTSRFLGDPTAGSEIRLLASLDGGSSWRVDTVAPVNAFDRQHVHPGIAVDREGEHVQIAYYVQQVDERLRVDLLAMEVEERRTRIAGVRPASSVAFDLTPSNNPIPEPRRPFQTTNYDRTFTACYDIGEYLSISANGEVGLAAWGDNRNPWVSAPGSPTAGTALNTHAQVDVFFTRTDD